MTKLVVPIMVQELHAALAAAARAAEQGADLVEYRLDTFTADLPAVTALVARSALPCIVTCRIAAEGGGFAGDDATRLAVFAAACAGPRPPVYLDVELAAYQRSADLRERVHHLVGAAEDQSGGAAGGASEGASGPGLILSSHDFETRPADLYQRLEAMTNCAAARVVKVVWRARSLRDNLEAFELLLARHKPTIALCMGEAGLPSRVLAGKFGALLTFAALEDGAGTAPGQPTVRALKHLYRWDKIGPRTQVFGVIGHPVGHSLSPAIHNAGFDAVGFDGVYLPLPIPPEYEHFKATVASWLDLAPLHFRGASVTIPHKENLLRFVRERGGEIEPLAERIGAANTLAVRAAGSLYAANTDYAAALDAVCDSLGIRREELASQRVAVIGAGGAARAIVAGFAHYGAAVVIYNRTAAKAALLAEQFAAGALGAPGIPGRVTAAPLEALADSTCQVFINCTPIGMSPHTDATPAPAGVSAWGPGTPGTPGTPGAVVFDTIYNPVETRLLREARAAGCRTIPGTEMFVRQGAAQFELWTGRPAPHDVFARVLRERLGAR